MARAAGHLYTFSRLMAWADHCSRRRGWRPSRWRSNARPRWLTASGGRWWRRLMCDDGDGGQKHWASKYGFGAAESVAEVTRPAGSPLGEKLRESADIVRDFHPGFSTRRGYRQLKMGENRRTAPQRTVVPILTAIFTLASGSRTPPYPKRY